MHAFTQHLTSKIDCLCNDLQDSIESVVTQLSCNECNRLTCMDVFQPTQHLIQEELMVFRCQVIICLDDLQVPTQHVRTLDSLLVHLQMKMQSCMQAKLFPVNRNLQPTWWRSVSMSSNTTYMSLN